MTSIPRSKRKHRATVGHISVPELPWQEPTRPGEHCVRCHRPTAASLTPAELVAYCAEPDHDQTLCDCHSPFDCI